MRDADGRRIAILNFYAIQEGITLDQAKDKYLGKASYPGEMIQNTLYMMVEKSIAITAEMEQENGINQ